MGVKIDLDNFEYNSKYKVPNEHRWDSLKNTKEENKYFIEEHMIPFSNICQSCRGKRGIHINKEERNESI